MGSGDRYKRHITTKLHKCENNYTKFNLIKSLIESGNTPLSIKIYEDLNRKDAIEIEKDIIKFFGKKIDKTGILTNISNGGEDSPANRMGGDNIHSKKVYQYYTDGSFYKEWDSLSDAARYLDKRSNTIGDCCRGKIKTAYGYQWTYEYKDSLSIVIPNEKKSIHKKVYKFDYYGNIVNEYTSLRDACLDNGVQKSTLSSAILNKKNLHNFMYSYNEDFKVNFNRLSHFHQIEVNGEIINITNKEIMKQFNVSKYYYTCVKRGKIKKPKFKVIY